MFKDLLKQMFCVNDKVSLTKTGAAIKSLSATIGGSLGGLTYFAVDHKAGVGLLISSAVLTGIGNWIEAVGKRNAMEKNKN